MITNKRKKILISFAVLLIAIIYIPDIYIDYKNEKINKIKLPTRYNKYQSIDSLALNNKYVTKYIGTDYGYLYQVNDSIIAFSISKKEEETIWYKVNIYNGLTDSIHFTNKRISFDANYLFNHKKSNYYSWLIDGDTIKKDVISISSDGTMKENEIKALLKKKEPDWVSRIENFGDKRKEKIVFLKEGNWYEIYTMEKNYDINTNFNHTTKTEGINQIETKHVKFVHFQRNKIGKSTFWKFKFNFGTPNGGGRVSPTAYGTAYFNIKINKKLIKLKNNYASFYKKSNDVDTNLGIYLNWDSEIVLIKSYGGYYIINPFLSN